MVLVESLDVVERPAEGVDCVQGTRAHSGPPEIQVDGDREGVLQPVAAVRGEEPEDVYPGINHRVK